jgi:hypothetical protein
MKRLAFLATLVLSAGVAFAQQPPQQPPQQQPMQQPAAQQPATSSDKAAGATKEIMAEVVSTDPVAKTITVLKREGMASDPAAQTTLPVEAKALTALKTVTPGEKVKLVCRTSAGKETAVTSIEKADKSKSSTPTNPPKNP